jgi:hypothetical protein
MVNKTPLSDSNASASIQDIAPGKCAALVAVVLATALVMTVACAMLPSSPWTRVRQLDGTIYSNLIWARQRIFVDKTPINVAVVGDSRVKFGVSGPFLEYTLTQQLGRPVHVVNFATLHVGRDLHYLLARDIIINHPEMRVLVLSIFEIPTKRTHPTFYLLANPDDLLSAPIFSYDYFPNLLKLPYRQLSLFVSERMEAARPLPAYLGSNPETGGFGPDRIVPAKEAARAEYLLREWMGGSNYMNPILLPERLRKIEFASDYVYLDRISALARSHNVKVVFVYQPCYGYIKPPAYVLDYEKYGYVLNIHEFATNINIHADVFHTNKAGKRLMTQKIADAVAEQMR